MSEDEVIPFYTLSTFDPGLFGGKRSNKSDIGSLTDYAKWSNNSLHIGLGYDIEEMLDPVHWYIKMVISVQYQPYPHIRALDTAMALKALEFISALVRWIDDTYESLLVGGNTKEDVWRITTRVIRSVF